MFNWIRARVKQAVLLGVGDALEHLAGGVGSDYDAAEATLDERCRLLPASGAGHTDGEDPFVGTPAPNGRGRKNVKAS